MSKSVTISVDAGSGSLFVDDGALFLGEQAPVTFTGVTLDTGHAVRLTIFDLDGVTPLADNHTDAGIVDLRGERLRKVFDLAIARGALTFPAEAIELDEDGEATQRTLARGMLAVNWSPVVYEAASGAVATLKGDTGEKGAAGAPGPAGVLNCIRDASGKWHKVTAVANELDELVVAVDGAEHSAGPMPVQDETLYLMGV